MTLLEQYIKYSTSSMAADWFNDSKALQKKQLTFILSQISRQSRGKKESGQKIKRKNVRWWSSFTLLGMGDCVCLSRIKCKLLCVCWCNCSARCSNIQAEPCLQLTGAKQRIWSSCGLQFPNMTCLGIGEFPCVCFSFLFGGKWGLGTHQSPWL